ncbi:hypothetical protein [Cognatiyoonia sp. IB215182]|uniref:hypothetical protein n=1 Tax=Cognatiyoonia sp. IB215182 TaxID=3097353 RepID=UPI002A0B258C|nr:hypothetical protein [Cognatiyoonia sp. IB215182]MDX8354353.1 hypothetical protein [Cognatiyoonia sp. IB215182]
MSNRDDMKKRARELGLSFKGNISNDALEELIKEAEAARDTGAVASTGENDSGQIGAATPPPGESAADAVGPRAADAATDEQTMQPCAATGTSESGAAPQNTPRATHATEGAESAAPSDVASASSSDAPQSSDGKAGGTETAVPPQQPATGVMLRVTGPKKGRRRAEYQFDRQPVDIPLDDLDYAERLALQGDPKLTLQLFQDGEPLTDPMQGGTDPAAFEQTV